MPITRCTLVSIPRSTAKQHAAGADGRDRRRGRRPPCLRLRRATRRGQRVSSKRPSSASAGSVSSPTQASAADSASFTENPLLAVRLQPRNAISFGLRPWCWKGLRWKFSSFFTSTHTDWEENDLSSGSTLQADIASCKYDFGSKDGGIKWRECPQARTV
ncbi:hypothetical protein SETIT_4G100800v2 [Setaria italica]|uniref:Uncharacterized protein n=1 Tax=Setaria italica TaxID=4555 RepID=A0A368QSM2_SETIT|nr:hypothetical protein SETIT_4G100800v2 [Setaria italica]